MKEEKIQQMRQNFYKSYKEFERRLMYGGTFAIIFNMNQVIKRIYINLQQE